MNVATDNPNRIEAWVSAGGNLDLCPVIDVDEFLDTRVEKNEELDAQYVNYCEVLSLDLSYESALQFAKSLEGTGIHGDGDPIVVNTSKNEDFLSAVLQYVYWEDENGPHILLQKHGGGDLRGNYPAPDAFDVLGGYGSEGTCIFDNARASIYCNDCDKYWDTDDGYHWWCDTERPNLEDYEASDERPKYHPKPNASQNLMQFYSEQPQQIDTGIVWVDDNKQPHCPFCGGILDIAPYPVG